MSVNQKRGISWTFLSTISGAVLQTLQLAMTVRYLSTTEVGVLAIVNVLIAIANMLKDFGLSSFLIHRQDISHREQSGLFWLTVTIGVLIAAFVGAIAYPMAWFYDMPQLDQLLYLSAANILLIASSSQWQALMLKKFEFERIAQIELVTKVLAFASTYIFLELGAGVYSPILALLSSNVINLILLYIYNRKRFIPSLVWDKEISRQAFSYGIYQVGGQFLNQLRANLDTLLLGKFLGADSVGIYSLAKELILRPARLIQPVVNRFALPNFAQVQGDESKQGELYLKTATVLVVVNGIVYSSILLLAAPLTHLLYGEEISQKVTFLLQILTVFGFVRCIGGPMGAIAQANGRTNLEFRWNVISTVIFSVILFFAANHSVMATTCAMSLGQVLMTHLSYQLFLKPLCKVSYRQFAKLSIPMLILLSVQIAALNFIELSLVQYLLVVILMYFALLATERHSFKQVLTMLRS